MVSFDCFNDPLEPVLPSWDVNLTLPFANRSYTLSEIVRRDTSILRAGVGGLITYSLSEPLRPTYLREMMTFTPRDTTRYVKFGVFNVYSPDRVVPIEILWLPPGSYIPIPDTTIDLGDLRDTIPTFQSVTFDSGTISLTIRNNLPVPIDVVAPIYLVNEGDAIIATFVFSPSIIPPNESRTASDDLAGKTLGNVIHLSELIFHTPGSASPVLIPSGSPIVTTLSTSNLRARRAVQAVVPPQHLKDNDSVQVKLDDSTLVREVRLKSGSFTLSFQSRVNLDLLCKYRFKELERVVSGAYVPYEDSIYLAAQGSGSKVLDLANYRILSRTAGLLNSLELSTSVILPNGSPGPVTVSDTDKVLITITRGVPIVADTIVGVLKPTWVNVSTSIKANFGYLPTRFSGQLHIPSAALGFSTLSTIDFPMDLYLKIGARKSAAGDSAFLLVPVSQRRLNPGSNSVQFNEGEVGQFLSQFSGSLPDSLHICGRVLVNPRDVYNPAIVGHLGQNSSFGGMMHLDVPMMLGIVDGLYRDTLSLGDTTGDGHQDFQINRDRFNDVNYGKMYVEVENGMPIQVGIRLGLLNGDRQSLLQLPQSGQPMSFNEALVDAQGNIIAPARSTSTLELSDQDVRQFKPAEMLSYSFELHTPTGSSAVRFRTSDYVRVRIWSRLSYRVNK
jgi:hypothetical protein